MGHFFIVTGLRICFDGARSPQPPIDHGGLFDVACSIRLLPSVTTLRPYTQTRGTPPHPHSRGTPPQPPRYAPHAVARLQRQGATLRGGHPRTPGWRLSFPPPRSPLFFRGHPRAPASGGRGTPAHPPSPPLHPWGLSLFAPSLPSRFLTPSNVTRFCAVLGWGWVPPSPACGCAARACRSPLRARLGVSILLRRWWRVIIVVGLGCRCRAVAGCSRLLGALPLSGSWARCAAGPAIRHAPASLSLRSAHRLSLRSPFFSAGARCCVLAFLGFPLSRRLARFAPKKASPSDRPQETFFIGYRTDVTQR